MAGEVTSGGSRRKRPHKYACGTPKEHCCGSSPQLAGSVSKCKVHSTPTDAWKCYADYLISQGYTCKSNGEFHKEGYPIYMLGKKSKFGSRFRGGKGDRFMAQQFLGGCIT